jgi:hypothetical protein
MKLVFVWIPAELGLLERQVLLPIKLPVDWVKRMWQVKSYHLFIVFKSKKVWDSWMAPAGEEYPEMTYAATKNGWMEAKTVSNYFTRSFIRNIHPERPSVLICDRHTSYIGVGLIENARKENVVILKLPPYTNHVLQPMDLCVFRPLKLMWDEEIIKWQCRNYARKLPKSTFSFIISKIGKNISLNIVQNGLNKAEFSAFVAVLF